MQVPLRVPGQAVLQLLWCSGSVKRMWRWALTRKDAPNGTVQVLFILQVQTTSWVFVSVHVSREVWLAADWHCTALALGQGCSPCAGAISGGRRGG